MSSVSLTNATKNYDDIRVIHGVDLHIEAGDFCVFVGPFWVWQVHSSYA